MPSTQIDAIDGVSTSLAVKAPVRCAIASLSAFSGLQLIATVDDGTVQLVEGDRVLYAPDIANARAGIYDVHSGLWTRAVDFDGPRDATEGTRVFTWARALWVLNTVNPIVIGVTPLLWVRENLVPSNARKNLVLDFNVPNDGSTTTTRARLQYALDSGEALWAPPGDYTMALDEYVEYDAGRFNMIGVGGAFRSNFLGSNPITLFRQRNVILTRNGPTGSGVGNTVSPITLEGVRIANTGLGSGLQMYNHVGSILRNVLFTCFWRGIECPEGFSNRFEYCQFNGSLFGGRHLSDLSDAELLDAVALLVCAHSTVWACDFNGYGTAFRGSGTQISFKQARIEECGFAADFGGLAEDTASHGTYIAMSASEAIGLQLEANDRNLWYRNFITSNTDEINVTAEPGGPAGFDPAIVATGDTRPRWGILYGDISGSQIGKKVVCSGSASFKEFATRQSVAVATTNFASVADQVASVGSLGVEAPETFEQLEGIGNTSALIEYRPRILQRGVTSLDLSKPIVPCRNIGGPISVPNGATTFAYSFTGAKTSGDAAFNTNPHAVGDVGSTLAIGTYYYAVTAILPRGETGVDITGLNNNYRSVAIAALQRADMDFSGIAVGSVGNFRRRIYRGRSLTAGYTPVTGAFAKQFDGYFELAAGVSTFSDSGQAFTKSPAFPPGSASVAATQIEDDAAYSVVVTPSWDAGRWWVTGKLTTGFTIHFNTGPTGDQPCDVFIFRG